jgi:hypothetical protein
MCCDAPKAPPPDPAIGQAALANAELGKEWLNMSKDQFAKGELRQEEYDKLIKEVVGSQIANQNQANQWAIEDRSIQAGLRDKYEGWADEDRQLGRDVAGSLDGIAKDAEALAQQYEQTYGKEAQRQSEFGQEEMDRYRSTFRPVQDKLASDAMSWDSTERLESEAAKARADVVGNAAQQRAANQRSMASMGVDPRSGRFAGVERATDLATALGAAGAQNAARDNVRAQGIQLRGQAAQVGQQVLGNGQQANQLSLSATGAGHNARVVGQNTGMQAKNLGLAAAGVGNTSAGLSVGQQGAGYTGIQVGNSSGSSAVANFGAGQNNFYQNGNVMSQGFSGAIGANNSAANILNTQYGNQLNAWAAGQQAGASNAAGIGSTIGTLGSLGLKAWALSSKDLKEDKRPVTGALAAINGLPVEAWKYKDGVADGGEHIGPYAEDFKEVTGKGNGKAIPLQDAIGITMKAVQELDQKVEKAIGKRKGGKR